MEIFDGLSQDVRSGLRVLRRSPAFAATALFILIVTIAATTLIFGVIDALLLKPLPYPGAEQLFSISASSPSRGLTGVAVSFTKLTRIQQQSHSFESVGAYLPITASVSIYGKAEQVIAARATANFFRVLRFEPAIGRSFTSQEDQEGGNDVAVLSNGFWQSHFAGDRSVVGKSLSIDGRSVLVVGILPQSFRFPFQQPEPAIWFPRVFEYPAVGRTRVYSGAGYLSVVARLRSDIRPAKAQAETDAINTSYSQDNPGFADGTGQILQLSSLKESLVGPVRPSLLVLFAAVVFLLLIGCVNIASLLIARANARQRDIAIRGALGASWLRLTRQLLTESLVLSLLGGAGGVLLALAAGRLLRLLPDGTLPGVNGVDLNLSVLSFIFGVCVAAGIGFGLLPTVQLAHENLHETLKEGGRGSTGSRRGARSRGILIVAEVGVAVVLAIGAGILLRSLARLVHVPPGVRAAKVATFSIALPDPRYHQPERQSEFYRQLVERVQTIPGVESAATVTFLPFTGAGRFVYFCPQGVACQGLSKDPLIAMQQITPDYFRAMGIPLLKGRMFDQHDIAGVRPVVIISQMTADKFFNHLDPIGKTLANSRDMIPMEIVGVVGDVRFNGLNAPYFQQMYLPEAQNPAAAMSLIVRSRLDLEALTTSVRHELAKLDPDLPLANVSSMDDVIASSIAQPRLTAEVVASFAGLALLLASVGVYGTLAYSVAQRRQEMGVRMVLGATPIDITKLIVGQGMRLVAAGIGIGLVSSLVLTRLIESLLFGVSAHDPLTLCTAVLVLTVVTLFACYLPARKAARLDPLLVLRSE